MFLELNINLFTYLIVAETAAWVDDCKKFIFVDYGSAYLLINKQVFSIDSFRFRFWLFRFSLDRVRFNVLVLDIYSCQEKLTSILLLFSFDLFNLCFFLFELRSLLLVLLPRCGYSGL